jgi:hypothetical protein
MAKRTSFFTTVASLTARPNAEGTPAAQTALEVLSPRGEVAPPPTMGIRPRVTDLAGKKIALCDNGKAGVKNFLDAIEGLFRKNYPTATILRMGKPEAGRIIYDATDWYPQVARQADAFIFATGD